MLAVLCLTSLVPRAAAEPRESKASIHTARLETPTLRMVIADNEAYPPEHEAGYNGVAELRLGGWSEPDLFVPAYGGLNLEHVFSGDVDSFGWDIFEPRRALWRSASPRTAGWSHASSGRSTGRSAAGSCTRCKAMPSS